MGNIHLRIFPGTPNWERVRRAIEAGGEIPEIADLILKAAQRRFKTAGDDPALFHTLRLIISLPQVARLTSPIDFQKALQDLGIQVTDPVSTFTFLSAFQNSLAEYARQSPRPKTDITELGIQAATESLTIALTSKTGQLFGTSTEALQTAIGSYSQAAGFAAWIKVFSSSFLNRYLQYHLSLELSNHVGGSRRFYNIQEHSEFKAAVDQYSRRVTTILSEYAQGWYTKHIRGGDIPPAEIQGFWHYALNKIRKHIRSGAGRGE